eukprot:gnl/MRDRNA2_/MRDRNA2_82315_c0_seq2.p1 gnl/MRDRNA2_/MRDRNA2_82315_c0~~gnl/MRDRNA2_/MRDRNA2_82315_c0_seq2.p1  ORF type:complete len:364 (+),score=64.72 gnl/MRDRNA2_/MRDRNA2_82315_c0_seq2:89-1180(+)
MSPSPKRIAAFPSFELSPRGPAPLPPPLCSPFSSTLPYQLTSIKEVDAPQSPLAQEIQELPPAVLQVQETPHPSPAALNVHDIDLVEGEAHGGRVDLESFRPPRTDELPLTQLWLKDVEKIDSDLSQQLELMPVYTGCSPPTKPSKPRPYRSAVEEADLEMMQNPERAPAPISPDMLYQASRSGFQKSEIDSIDSLLIGLHQVEYIPACPVGRSPSKPSKPRDYKMASEEADIASALQLERLPVRPVSRPFHRHARCPHRMSSAIALYHHVTPEKKRSNLEDERTPDKKHGSLGIAEGNGQSLYIPNIASLESGIDELEAQRTGINELDAQRTGVELEVQTTGNNELETQRMGIWEVMEIPTP